MDNITAAIAAKRSLDEVEQMAAQMAAQMARFPGREHVWAIERIRIIADATYYSDAAVRRLTLAVLAGLDLAERRRRVAP